MERRINIIVSGLVQGVGYRNFIAGKAETLGLSGWVRNLPGGEVEIDAGGASGAIDRLLDEARKGPRLAKVSAVRSEELKQCGEYVEGFRVRY